MEKGDINQAIGARLRKLRSERHLTLEALAEQTGVSVSMLSAIERGRKSPTLTILNKINSGMQISLAALFDEVQDDDRRIIHKSEMRTFKFDKGAQLEMIFDCEHCVRFDVKRQTILPHTTWKSEPHFGGELWEYCYVSSGSLLMVIEGIDYRIKEGEVFSFRANVEHTYSNDDDALLDMFIISAYR